MKTQTQQLIVSGISEDIGRRLSSLAAEECAPMRGADASDDFITQTKREIAALRKCRDDLEEIFAGRIHFMAKEPQQ